MLEEKESWGTRALLPLNLGAVLRCIAAQHSTNRNRKDAKLEGWPMTTVGTVPLTDLWREECQRSRYSALNAMKYAWFCRLFDQAQRPSHTKFQTYRSPWRSWLNHFIASHEEMTSLDINTYGSNSADYERFAGLTGLVKLQEMFFIFFKIFPPLLAGDTFPSHFGVVDIAVIPSKTCGLSSSHPIRINKMGHRRLSKLILAYIWRLFHTECQHNSHQFQQLHFHSLPIIPLHAVRHPTNTATSAPGIWSHSLPLYGL